MEKKQLFLLVFLRSPSKVTNFNTSPMPSPPFENFLLNTLNSEQKPSAKNQSTGPVRNRSTGDDFEIYRSGRVEKILTGSISGSNYWGDAGLDHSLNIGGEAVKLLGGGIYLPRVSAPLNKAHHQLLG